MAQTQAKKTPSGANRQGSSRRHIAGGENDYAFDSSALVGLDGWSALAMLICRDALDHIREAGPDYRTVWVLSCYDQFLDVVDLKVARAIRRRARQLEVLLLRPRRTSLRHKASAFVARADLRAEGLPDLHQFGFFPEADA